MDMDGKVFRPFLYVKMSDNFYIVKMSESS